MSAYATIPPQFDVGDASLQGDCLLLPARGVFDGPNPLIPASFAPDIYNVQPALGFYCLYRPRPGENVTADTVVCENITGVARQQ